MNEKQGEVNAHSDTTDTCDTPAHSLAARSSRAVAATTAVVYALSFTCSSFLATPDANADILVYFFFWP